MTKMLSRDGPFELNLKDVVDYCHTIENENHERFTSIIDSEGAVGKCLSLSFDIIDWSNSYAFRQCIDWNFATHKLITRIHHLHWQ